MVLTNKTSREVGDGFDTASYPTAFGSGGPFLLSLRSKGDELGSLRGRTSVA